MQNLCVFLYVLYLWCVCAHPPPPTSTETLFLNPGVFVHLDQSHHWVPMGTTKPLLSRYPCPSATQPGSRLDKGVRDGGMDGRIKSSLPG